MATQSNPKSVPPNRSSCIRLVPKNADSQKYLFRHKSCLPNADCASYQLAHCSCGTTNLTPYIEENQRILFLLIKYARRLQQHHGSLEIRHGMRVGEGKQHQLRKNVERCFRYLLPRFLIPLLLMTGQCLTYCRHALSTTHRIVCCRQHSHKQASAVIQLEGIPKQRQALATESYINVTCFSLLR